MFVFVVNPVAGGSAAKSCMEQLEQTLRAEKIDYQVMYTEHAGHGTQLAKEAAALPNVEAVVAVGGDGTLSEVASGLLDTGVPMGIIPSGTGNDFIRSFDYPRDPQEALKRILKKELKPVDLVSFNDRCFINVAGMGFDVTVLQQMERYHGKFKGMLPYLFGLLRTIFIFQPIEIDMELDGKRSQRRVLICSAANGKIFGGGIPICPKADVDDGLLDIVIVNTVPRWRIPFYLPGLLMGHVLKWKITEHVRCKSVRLIGHQMYVQTDGEIRCMDEAAMQIQPGRLKLYR